MCWEIAKAVTAIGLSAAGSMYGYNAAKSVAKFDADAANLRNEASRKAIRQSGGAAYGDVLDSYEQNLEAIKAQGFDNEMAGLAARSSAIVAAGEAGAMGLGVEALVQSFYAQQGRNEGRIARNADNLTVGTRSEVKQIRRQLVNAQSQFAVNTPRKQVSAIPYAMNFAQDSLKAISGIRV
jgi:hypothetical protein